MSTSSEKSLAISIARCSGVEQATQDKSHPCHKVVTFQSDSRDRHIPEPWFGNISNCEVLFISSNPSIDQSEGNLGENYPRANWSDAEIGEWVTRRVDQTWSEVPVTFRNQLAKDFNWRCKDGQYRGVGPSNSPQTTWNNLHKTAEQLLGSSADPSENYALTEIVHCKSTMAFGVPEASLECASRWLPSIISVACHTKLVVFLGANVRPWVKKEFAGKIPSEFGSAVESGGANVARRDCFIDYLVGDDGVQRKFVFCYLPHPTASEKGGRTFRSRFGDDVTTVLGSIASGEMAVPDSTESLHLLFAGA